MNAYIYQADLVCEECGDEIKMNLIASGILSTGALKDADVNDESTFDSDDYPKGPCGDGGGESDCPQHCGNCHIPLENPLTEEGVKYVLESIHDSIETALNIGRSRAWDRIIPMKGTAEDDPSFAYWHGQRHVEILRGWAKQLQDYNLEKDEAAIVSLFLELSEAP